MTQITPRILGSETGRDYLTVADFDRMNKAAQQPAVTTVKKIYNLYLMGQRVCDTAKAVRESTDPAVLAPRIIRTFAMPLAQATGSQYIEKGVFIASEAVGFYSNPAGYVISKGCQFAATMGTKAVVRVLGVVDPEIKDMIDIVTSEAACIGAKRLESQVQKKLEESHAKASEVLAKEQAYQEEKQKFEQQKGHCEELKKKAVIASKKTQDAQYIANLGANAAADKQGVSRSNRSGISDQQIAAEISQELAARSIVDENPARYHDIIKTGMSGKAKNKNAHTTARVNDCLKVINQENAAAVKTAEQSLETQQQAVEASASTLEEAQKELSLLDKMHVYLGSKTGESSEKQSKSPVSKTSSKPQFKGTKNEIENLYVENENKAKAILEKEGLKLDSKKGLERARNIIVSGVASDLCKIEGSYDQYDLFLQQIDKSMDKSDRRWFNDVCGEIHQICHKVPTDQFQYEEKKLKKICDSATSPIKKVMNALDSVHSETGERFTINGSVGSDGGLSLGTPYNPRVLSKDPPKKPHVIEKSKPSSKSESTSTGSKGTTTEEQVCSPNKLTTTSSSGAFYEISASEPFVDANYKEVSDSLKADYTSTKAMPLSSEVSKPLEIIKDLSDLASSRVPGVGLISTTVSACQNIEEKGFVKGAIQTVAEEALLLSTPLRGLVAASDLYATTFPEEGDGCKKLYQEYEKLKDQNAQGKPSYTMKKMEYHMLDAALECTGGDAALRFPGKVYEACVDKISSVIDTVSSFSHSGQQLPNGG